MKPHKWHDEIVAWASGAEIEIREYKRDKALDRYVWSNWNDNFFPEWLLTNVEYRIKPQPKEPLYCYMYVDKLGNLTFKTKYELLDGKMFVSKIKVEDE